MYCIVTPFARETFGKNVRKKTRERITRVVKNIETNYFFVIFFLQQTLAWKRKFKIWSNRRVNFDFFSKKTTTTIVSVYTWITKSLVENNWCRRMLFNGIRVILLYSLFFEPIFESKTLFVNFCFCLEHHLYCGITHVYVTKSRVPTVSRHTSCDRPAGTVAGEDVRLYIVCCYYYVFSSITSYARWNTSYDTYYC